MCYDAGMNLLYSAVPALSVISMPSSNSVAMPKSIIFTCLRSLLCSNKMLSGCEDERGANIVSLPRSDLIFVLQEEIWSTYLHVTMDDLLPVAVVQTR